MTPVLIYSLFILITTLGAQKLLRPKVVDYTRASPQATGAVSVSPNFAFTPVFLTIGLFGLAAIFTYQTAQLYSLWAAAGAPSSYLLPPYQSGYYFFYYALTTIWANSLIAFGIGLLIISAMRIANHKAKERFFHREEYALALLSITLVGHPLWILYIATLLLLLVSFAVVRAQRVTLLSFWLPVAIGFLLISPYLKGLSPIIRLRL